LAVGDADQTAWTRTPAAQAARAALTTSLQSSAQLQLVGWSLDELFRHPGAPGTHESLRRLVRASEGAPSTCASLATLPSLLRQGDGGLVSAPLVSTCLYRVEGQEVVRLTTLVMPSEITLNRAEADGLLLAVFGADPIALQPTRKSDKFLSIHTAIRLGDACLTPVAVSEQPSSMRSVLRTAQRAQLLHGCRAALDVAWLAGFKAMSETLTGDFELAVPLQEALAAATGLRAGALSRSAIYERVRHAEALESVGKFAEAELVYRECLDADARSPGARLLMTPAMVWSYYGLALKRQEKWAAAEAAYESGIKSITGRGYAEPDTAEWRESVKLDLLDLLVTLHDASGNMQKRQVAINRIFRPQMELMVDRGETQITFENGSESKNGTSIYGLKTKLAWHIRQEEHAGMLMNAIRPLTSGRGPTTRPFTTSSDSWMTREDNVAAARKLLGKTGAGSKAVPRLPRPSCSACGLADAPKRCGACGGPAYCDAECQKKHWRAAHKTACAATSTPAAAAK